MDVSNPNIYISLYLFRYGDKMIELSEGHELKNKIDIEFEKDGITVNGVKYPPVKSGAIVAILNEIYGEAIVRDFYVDGYQVFVTISYKEVNTDIVFDDIVRSVGDFKKTIKRAIADIDTFIRNLDQMEERLAGEKITLYWDRR